MDDDSRNLIILGAFLLAYGVLQAYINGWRVPTVTMKPQLRKPAIDMNRLTFMKAYRDDMIEQEHAEIEPD